MTKQIDSDWHKIRDQFKTGLLGSLIICFITLIYPGFETKPIKFITEKKILKEKPKFKKERNGKNVSYYIDFVFKDTNKKLQIGSVDYNYLDYKKFKTDINAGDTVIIKRHNKYISYFSKNNFEYLNYEKAEPNRRNSVLALGLLFLPFIPICFVVILLKKHPTYRFNNKSHKIKFPWIVISILIITYLILKSLIPFEIVTNGKFME